MVRQNCFQLPFQLYTVLHRCETDWVIDDYQFRAIEAAVHAPPVRLPPTSEYNLQLVYIYVHDSHGGHGHGQNRQGTQERLEKQDWHLNLSFQVTCFDVRFAV